MKPQWVEEALGLLRANGLVGVSAQPIVHIMKVIHAAATAVLADIALEAAALQQQTKRK